MSTAKRGTDVLYTPSERTKKDFENLKSNYLAKVTEVNENSVDLFIYDELKTVHRVQHSDLAPEGRSKWENLEVAE